MPNKYYYLVASLPQLYFGKETPITIKGFLDECGKWLNPGHLACLEKIDPERKGGGAKGCLLYIKWNDFYKELKENLKKARKIAKNRTKEKIPDNIKDIFRQNSPLDMELVMEKKKWDFIENESFGYDFDINSLVAYKIKLQILERITGFNKEKGKNIFNKSCEVKYDKK